MVLREEEFYLDVGENNCVTHEWKVPCFPVKPWQMTLVSLLIHTAADADILATFEGRIALL